MGNREIESWPLKKLKDHPRQAEMFGDVTEAELEALAKDIEENGLRVPIEVLPDGTIITGHQRARAARRLKWKSIDAIVRHDLAEAGDAAVEELLIKDNLIRRQLTPLGRARCARRLMEAREGYEVRSMAPGKREALKAEIAEQLGVSVRTVNRLLLVLDAPTEVQQAFDRGDIPLVEAGQVALLPAASQAQVAACLGAGDTPREALAGLLPARRAGHAKLGPAVDSFAKALRRGVDDIGGRADEVAPGFVREFLPDLQAAHEMIGTLISRAKSNKPDDDGWFPTRPSGRTRCPADT